MKKNRTALDRNLTAEKLFFPFQETNHFVLLKVLKLPVERLRVFSLQKKVIFDLFSPLLHGKLASACLLWGFSGQTPVLGLNEDLFVHGIRAKKTRERDIDCQRREKRPGKAAQGCVNKE